MDDDEGDNRCRMVVLADSTCHMVDKGDNRCLEVVVDSRCSLYMSAGVLRGLGSIWVVHIPVAFRGCSLAGEARSNLHLVICMS